MSRVGVAYEVTLRCEDAIERVGGLPGDFGIVGGVVTLPTGDSAATALATTDFGGPDPASRLFAKTGLLTRPGREFAVVVPEGYRNRVAIGWGNPGTETHRLLVPACPSKQEGWLVFAGGIAIADPECITLGFESGSIVESFTGGVGAPCSGQDPPRGSSDT